MPCPIRYHFRQSFQASAPKVYAWCTNFTPQDHTLMGEEDVKRIITRLTESTIVLNDTFMLEGHAIEKQKLVQLYPDKLMWTSTHLTGPAKYSQFIYEITADDKDTSHIDFTGLFLDFAHETLSKTDVEKLATQMCREDAYAWKLLSEAINAEIGKKIKKDVKTLH